MRNLRGMTAMALTGAMVLAGIVVLTAWIRGVENSMVHAAIATSNAIDTYAKKTAENSV